MDETRSKEIDRDLLTRKWTFGIAGACFTEGRSSNTRILSLPVEDYSSEDCTEALRLLGEKYKVHAVIKRSSSMDNQLVIRVEGLLHIEKLAEQIASLREIAPPKMPNPNAQFFRRRL